MKVLSFSSISLASFVILVSIYSYPFYHWMIVVGLFRTPRSTQVPDGDFIFIEDTIHCEDIHHHVPSNLVFTACDDSIAPRFSWFPPLGHLDDPTKGLIQGSIHVIDPESMRSRRLSFTNFTSTFVTHGIDVIDDPLDPNAVYIAAINHVPNPDYMAIKQSEKVSKETPFPPITASQIELFHHVLHTDSIEHVRSMRHPLITTPNDIVALSPTSFYVTNDHYYLSGIGRVIEDAVPLVGKWSNVIHVSINDPLEDSTSQPSHHSSSSTPTQAESGITATLALTKIHTANGLGHGPSSDTLLLTSAGSGILYVVTSPLLQQQCSTSETTSPDDYDSNNNNGNKNATLSILETIYIDSTIDNPSFFTIPSSFPPQTDTSSLSSSSYILLSGLTNAYRHAHACSTLEEKEPVIVWLVSWDANTISTSFSSGTGHPTGKGQREIRELFQDDGDRIRSASGNIVVPIVTDWEGQKREGWLFVTGYNSESVVAVRVEI